MADALKRMRERRAARDAERVTTARSCDGCDLCCIAPGIAELRKPPGQRCSSLCGEPGRSCSIYPSRPRVCSGFYCLWRATETVLPEWLRPADCGFLLAFNQLDEWPAVVTVHVDPERPDAWRSPWAITVFVTLAEHWNCLVAIGQVPITSHVICPDGSMIEVENNPWAMSDGMVGAPSFVFGPDRRPLGAHLRETVFSWGLPPPPGFAPKTTA
jgi:uncharacterized cysteine cluster protein YcgN (CxxCxxCC family)